jgi:hypothetical protein
MSLVHRLKFLHPRGMKVKFTLEQATKAPGGGGAENLAPPGFDPRTVLPVTSHYNDWAIPSHIHQRVTLNLPAILCTEQCNAPLLTTAVHDAVPSTVELIDTNCLHSLGIPTCNSIASESLFAVSPSPYCIMQRPDTQPFVTNALELQTHLTVLNCRSIPH